MGGWREKEVVAVLSHEDVEELWVGVHHRRKAAADMEAVYKAVEDDMVSNHGNFVSYTYHPFAVGVEVILFEREVV